MYDGDEAVLRFASITLDAPNNPDFPGEVIRPAGGAMLHVFNARLKPGINISAWDAFTRVRIDASVIESSVNLHTAQLSVFVSELSTLSAANSRVYFHGGVNSGHARVFKLSLEQLQDSDDDGVADRDDLFPLDPLESNDNDLDRIGDNADPDDDNDGTPDSDDALPFDATETIDTDGDGIGNNSDSDDDGDGIADSSDAFPLNATEWLDSDGDGLGNNTDPDDDNDGVTDAEDELPLDPSDSVDTDSDGVGNTADTDDDGDGVPDTIDACPLTVRVSDSEASNFEVEQSINVLEGCPGIWVRVGDTVKQSTFTESPPLAFSRDGRVVAVGGSEVTVYELMDGVWLKRSAAVISGETFDAFGSSIDISADGAALVVGAPESRVTGFSLGAVYTFDWDGETWLQRSVLSNDQSQGFGRSVSLSDDGKRLAVGAPDIPDFESGQTQVFEWSGTDWNQLGSTIPGEQIGDYAGSAVALSGDGQSLAIGAPGNDGNGDSAGHVRVYRWSGTSWSLRGGDIDALPADPFGFDTTAAGLNFGYSVALSVDGSTLVVGSSPGDMALSADPLSDPSGIGESLSPFGTPIRVFHWNGSHWVQRGENGLVPGGDNSGLASGDLVAISDDGLIVAVGQGPATAVRPVRLFIWNENSPIPRWEQLGNAIGLDPSQVSPAGEALYNSTGGTVALSGDGGRVAVIPVPDTLISGAESSLSVYEIQPRLPDRDADGVPDRDDEFPDDPSEALDTDGDGLGDNTDTDDDGDGVDDSADAFPLDSSESMDTDGDGAGNNADADDDNDGVSDEQELLDGTDPLDPSDFIAPYDDLNGYVYHWSNHSFLTGVTITRERDGVEESDTSDAAGRYSFAMTQEAQYAIRAQLALSERDTNRTITSADALAALKIAVGLNPNSDPDGSGPLSPLPVSALQLIAADMNQDGRVTSGDALAILKIAVGLSDALSPFWALVEDSSPLWETHANRSAVHDHTQAHTLVYPDQTQVNFAAVLVGDVNASWAAETGAQTLEHANFSEWAGVSGAPLSHWGIRDTDGDGLSDQQEEALGTAIDKVDTDDDGVNDAEDAYPLDPTRSSEEQLTGSRDSKADLLASAESPIKPVIVFADSGGSGESGRLAEPFTSITIGPAVVNTEEPIELLAPVLLRGDMNDWGLDLAFEPDESGGYVLSVRLEPGSYAFKIASDDWALMDLGAAMESERLIVIGQSVALSRNASAAFILRVNEASDLVFEIDSQNRLTVNVVH